jgi:SWI/SNF-related matrix-associated actin-dependent regulator of chromatin subfamily D
MFRVDKDFQSAQYAYDIEVEVDDVIKNKMASILSSTSQQKEINILDEKVLFFRIPA